MFHITWVETIARATDLDRDEALEFLRGRGENFEELGGAEPADDEIQDALKRVIEEDVLDAMECTDSSRWSEESEGGELSDVELATGGTRS